MEIVNKKIGELIPYEKNPRKNKDAVQYVANSIKEFGFKVPVVIDKNNVIVCGHTRYKASKQLGLKEIPCIVADDLTDEQIKAFRLADNKVGEIAEWDIDLLDDELDGILDIDMTDFGFDFSELEDEEKEIVEDEPPEPPAEPKAKYGDIYQLGEHRLMCGDSTKAEDVEKLMDGAIASIEITSPPYNVGDSSQLTGNTKMKESKYIHQDNLEEWMGLLQKTSDNGINFSKYAFINLQMLSNNKIDVVDFLEGNKDKLCDIIIWDKGFGAPAMAERVLNSAFEFVFIFSKWNNSRAIGTRNFRGTISNVFKCPPQRKNEFAGIHSATFPMEFPVFFVKNFTEEQEGVLDLFGGTGTTLIACEQLNRKCYMMELEPKYIDVIIQRWENFTGNKAVKLN